MNPVSPILHLVTGIGVKSARHDGTKRPGSPGVEYRVIVQTRLTRPQGRWSRPQWVNSARLFRSYDDAREVYLEAKAAARSDPTKNIAEHAERIGWNWERRS